MDCVYREMRRKYLNRQVLLPSINEYHYYCVRVQTTKYENL